NGPAGTIVCPITARFLVRQRGRGIWFSGQPGMSACYDSARLDTNDCYANGWLTYSRRTVVPLCWMRAVGQGMGHLAVETAGRVGPGDCLVGIDGSNAMIAHARHKVHHRQLPMSSQTERQGLKESSRMRYPYLTTRSTQWSAAQIFREPEA